MSRDVQVGRLAFTHFHPFVTRIAVAQDHCHRSRCLLIPEARPANAIRVIKIGVLRTIGKLFASFEERIDQEFMRVKLHRIPAPTIGIFHAVIIRIEDAGIALCT